MHNYKDITRIHIYTYIHTYIHTHIHTYTSQAALTSNGQVLSPSPSIRSDVVYLQCAAAMSLEVHAAAEHEDAVPLCGGAQEPPLHGHSSAHHP